MVAGLIIWGLIVILFCAWLLKLYKKKELITVLSTTVLMQIFIPLILMYPFGFSRNNIMSTGTDAYHRYIETLNYAFMISLLGILFFFIGVFIVAKFNGGNNTILNKFSTPFKFLTNTYVLTFFLLSLLCIFLLMIKLDFFRSIFDARAYAMSDPALRPIFNFFYSACSFFVILSLAAYYNKKSILKLVFIIVGLVFSLTSGTRGVALASILTFVFIYFNINQSKFKKTNIIKFIVIGFVLLIIAIYLGDVRNHQYNIIKSLGNACNSVFFGNNFSDLRDFSWVLAYWNGTLLYGKTYLSGFLSFIPSSLFPQRTAWGLGHFTVSTIGFDTNVHPGLRPGIFGEAYFNFGIIGVCLIGFVYGYVIGWINNFVQNSVNTSKITEDTVIRVLSGYVLAQIVFNFMITAGFFQVYVDALIIIIGIIIGKLFKKQLN